MNGQFSRAFSVQTNYKKLNELKQVGELNTKLAVEDLVGRIAAEYYYYIQQIKLFHNLGYAVSLSRERVRIDEERYLLGASSKLQLLQSLVYLNTDSSRYSQSEPGSQGISGEAERVNGLTGPGRGYRTAGFHDPDQYRTGLRSVA